MPPRPILRGESIPQIQIPASYRPVPDPNATFKRYFGQSIGRIIGLVWWMLTLLGAGSGIFGVFNFVVGLGAWTWLRKPPSPNNSV